MILTGLLWSQITGNGTPDVTDTIHADLLALFALAIGIFCSPISESRNEEQFNILNLN